VQARPDPVVADLAQAVVARFGELVSVRSGLAGDGPAVRVPTSLREREGPDPTELRVGRLRRTRPGRAARIRFELSWRRRRAAFVGDDRVEPVAGPRLEHRHSRHLAHPDAAGLAGAVGEVRQVRPILLVEEDPLRRCDARVRRQVGGRRDRGPQIGAGRRLDGCGIRPVAALDRDNGVVHRQHDHGVQDL